MKNTCKNELKELKDNIALWNKERLGFMERKGVHSNVERLRREVRIEAASNRILEITGRTKFYNTASKGANGYDSNLPPGLGEDPGDAPETRTCYDCEGNSVKEDIAYCSTCESTGELTEAGYPAHINQ